MDYSRDVLITRQPGTDVKKNMSETLISEEGHLPYMLAFPAAGKYKFIGSKEAYVWSCLYWPQSIASLTQMFFARYQVLAPNFIKDLIKEWHEDKFIKVSGQNNRVFSRFNLSFPNFHTFLQPLYDKFGKHILRHDRWLILIGISVFCLEAWSFTQVPIINAGTTISPLMQLGILLLLAMISAIIHEIGHGLAAMHWRINVQQAGFKFIWGLPVFYVDLSEVWVRPRNERILVTLAGPLTNLILAGLATIPLILRLASPDLVQVIREFIWINLFAIMINLIPVGGLDGYFILEDILGIPNLSKRARKAALMNMNARSRNLLRAYFVFSILTSIAFLIFTYRTWVGFFDAIF